MKKIFALMVAVAFGFGSVGCDSKPAASSSKKVEANNNAAKDAAKEVKEAGKDAVKEVKEAGKDAAKEVKDAVKEVKDAPKDEPKK